MKLIPSVCLITFIISGCSEGEPASPEPVKVPAVVPEPGLPMIAEELIDGSVAMELLAVTRHLDDVTAFYATHKTIQPSDGTGMERNLSRLQQEKPPASEVVLYDECMSLLKEVQTWSTATQEIDVQPARKKIKALKMALRINPSDRHNEPLMQAITDVTMLVIEPGMRGAIQKVDDADKLAAKPNTDAEAATLTQNFLKKVRELVTNPSKELQTEAIRLSRQAKWKLKLDTHRTFQLWKTTQAAAREQLPFGGMRRPGFKIGR